MRTFTTEHTVYTFSELSDEAKQKAIEGYREGLQYDNLEMFMQDQLTEHLLPKYKITPANVTTMFSLGYSQGDGAMFEGTVQFKAWTIRVKHYGHYYHYNSKTIESITSTKTGEEPSDKVWKRVFDEFEPLYVTICKELERYGYDEIEYQSSDDTISNWLANDYEFNEDGTLA